MRSRCTGVVTYSPSGTLADRFQIIRRGTSTGIVAATAVTNDALPATLSKDCQRFNS